jgi:hypothetical protein
MCILIITYERIPTRAFMQFYGIPHNEMSHYSAEFSDFFDGTSFSLVVQYR